jgi:hypothetical protein
MGFKSDIRRVGRLKFPEFAGTRVMMMPVRLDDPETVPMTAWREPFADLVAMAPAKEGVGYLTIDQAHVKRGETHRRPGLHVDGIGPDGKAGGWGGGGGGWGSNGMLVASDVVGCVGWAQEFDGYTCPNGDCGHLKRQLRADCSMMFWGGEVFWCGPLAVHRSLRMTVATRRTFVRLSMPNDCPWYEGYTRNPLGVEPTGPIHPARSGFMAYRSTELAKEKP